MKTRPSVEQFEAEIIKGCTGADIPPLTEAEKFFIKVSGVFYTRLNEMERKYEQMASTLRLIATAMAAQTGGAGVEDGGEVVEDETTPTAEAHDDGRPRDKTPFPAGVKTAPTGGVVNNPAAKAATAAAPPTDAKKNGAKDAVQS